MLLEDGILKMMMKVKHNGTTLMTDMAITIAMMSPTITTMNAMKMNLWSNIMKTKKKAGSEEMKKNSRKQHSTSAMMNIQVTAIPALEMLTWNKLKLLALETSGKFLKKPLISGFYFSCIHGRSSFGSEYVLIFDKISFLTKLNQLNLIKCCSIYYNAF